MTADRERQEMWIRGKPKSKEEKRRKLPRVREEKFTEEEEIECVEEARVPHRNCLRKNVKVKRVEKCGGG